MPNPNDNRKWLYDKLTEKGVKMGTYEQFDKAIDDENNLKWVYDKANSQGLKVGDYNQFSGALKRVAAETPATADKPATETVQPAETANQAAPESPATEKVEEKPATKPATPPKKPTLTDSYKVPEINTPFTQPERPDVPVPFAPETPVNSTEVKNSDEKAAAELREQTERDVQRYGTGNADYTFEEAVSAGREYERIAPEIAKYDERLKAFKDKYGPMEEIVKEVNEGKRKLTQEEYRKLQAQYPGYDKEAKALSELAKMQDAVMATAPGREYQAVSKRMDEIGKGAKTPEAVLEYAQEFSKLQRNPLYRAQLGENAPSEDEIQSDWLQAQIAYFDEKMKTATGDEKKELKKAFSDAKEALYANPYYRKHLEGKVAENKEVSTLIGEELAKRRNELTAEWTAKNGGAPDAWSAQGFEQWVQGDQEMKNLYAAAHMVDDAIREYQKPTKYDDSKGLRNVGKGLADWAGNTDTWSFGIEQFAEDIGVVRPILEKVEKLAGSLDLEHLTDSAMDELEKQLTQGEQAVLLGYFEKIMAVAAKGADTSIGYQIGQGIGDMVNLGVEMALTGPVGGAVRKGIDKAGMAAMKKLLTKRMYRQFAKSGVGRVALWTGHKAVRDVAETLVRIPFMPSTYKAIGEGAVELSSDYKTRDFMEYAPEKAFDNFVEQLTEVSNGFAFPLMGKVMKMRGMKNFVTSVIGKDSAKALRTFIERGDIKLLDDMMIGSFGGEWEEELLGAVIHSVTDDPNALRDFFSAEQQLVLLGTLAPIPLARGTVGGVQLAVPAAQADLAWNKAESELKRLGFDEGRIARLKEVVDNASAPEGARAIMQAMKDAGFSRSTAEGQGFLDAAGSPENDVLYGSVPEIDRDAYDALAHYYWRAQQKRAAGLMGEIEQDKKVRDKRAELKAKYGQFWHNAMGEEVVETGTIIGADGNPLNVFIASDEPMEDGRVAYVGEDGSNGFLSRDQLVGQNADGTFAPNPETTLTPINIYLAGLVMQDSQVQEAQGVVNEASAANTSLRDQIEGLADVKYKGQSGTITRADDNGAVFVPDEGENVRVTWAELAAENGIQEPEVKTPAERTGDAAALVAEHTRLKQELAGAFRQANEEAGKNGRGALMETEEGTATVVNIISDTIDPENGTAQFTVRMPDGSMNVTMATAIEPVMSQLRGESAPEPEPEPAPAPAPAPGPQPPTGGAGGAELDFRGNQIPMRDGEIDEEAFREKDPEAWAAWNDALPEGDPRKATLGTKKRLEGLAKASKTAADKAQKDLEKLYDKGATDKEIREKETEIRDQRARQKRYEDALGNIGKRELDKAEAEREAARKAAEAERLRREKEKEEEEKRKAGKAPDISEDTPEAAQKRGYIMVNGNRIDRPTPDAVAEKGKDTKIAFTKSVAVDGKYGLVEATRIEPSHVSDQENPLHFFAKKWQPKNRKRADSAVAIQQMANGIRPGEITRGETAYGGAPIVNERGEVIQGNGRSEALRRAYGQGTAAEYKAWLAEHAEEFGLTREQVEKMETPILVRVLDVDDARAEQLGKMEQKDLESGGDQRFNGKTLVKKMGKRFGEFLDYLFAGDLGDDATALDYINQNGYTALHWLHQNGFINDTEYANAQENGKLTEETVSAFRAMSIEPLFDNVPEKVRSGFEMLPNSVKLALQRSVATLYGLEGVIGDIQDALAYYCDFETADPAFKKAKNTTEAWDAVTAWMQNVRFDGTSEGEAHPSIVARRFASIFKGGVLVEGEKNPKRTEKAFRSLFTNIASTMRGEGGFMSAAEPTDNIGAYRENNVITEEEENQIRNGKNDNRPGPASGSGANGPVGGQGSGAVRGGRPGGVPERKPAGEGAGPVAPEAPAAPEPSAPKTGYGANNTLVTNEDYEELKKQWAELMGEAVTLGIVPKTMTLKQQMKLVSLGAQMAAYHIEAGVRKFVDLSKRLLQDVGESIRPYLKALYKAARELPGIGEYVNDMNTDAEVDAIDVDTIGKEEEPAEEPVEESEEEPAPAGQARVTPVSAKNFDPGSIDFDNNYVILHQTGSQNFDSILRGGLRVGNGLNGTTTLANRETLESILKAQADGRGHEGSDGLVILQIPKAWANGRDVRNLDQIDDILTERFGDSAIQTVPTDVITHAIATPKESAKAQIPVDTAEPAPAPEEKPKDELGENETKEIRDAVDAIVSGKDKKKRTINDSMPVDYKIAGKDVNSYIRDRYDKFKAPLEKRREEVRKELVAYRDRVEEQAKKDILARNSHIKEDNPHLPDYVSEEADKRLKNDTKFNELDSQIKAIDNEIGNYQERRYNAVAAVSEIYAKTEVKPEESKGKTSESPEKSVSLEVEKEARDKFTDTVAERLVASIASGERPFKSITDLRKVAREAGMEVDDRGATDILIQELTEVAIVRAARKFMSQFNGGLNSRNAFNAICKLYEMQPTISMRSSQRVAMQQYSTPLPMSFVAQMFAYKAGMKDVLEPTAGNGMLVFGIPADKVHANELDDTRKANLDAQGFKEVTQNDATEPFSGKYDAVVANPPFGSHDAVSFDGKSISGLDPVITLRALEAMKDDGKAAIIIGGNIEWADNGSWKSKKAFFAYLYDHYNVKGVVNMAGDMYARQGTSYPTTMILIDGRRSEEERAKSQVFPPVRDKARKTATTNDELFDIVTEILNDNRKTDGNEVVRAERERKSADRIGQTGSLFAGDDSAEPAENGTDGRGNDGGTVVQGTGRDAVSGKDEPGAPAGSRASGERPGNERDVPAAKPGELAERPADSGGEGVSGPVSGGRAGTDGVGSEVAGVGDAGRERPESVPSGEPAVRKPVRLARKVEDKNLPYVQHSSGRSLESVAPAAMVEAMDAAIQKIEKEQGRTIDEFVTEELGYESTAALHKALAAEQIDSVAMAIYQMKKGKAMIIGDQTGVGKGRQMAALIRWANRQGKKPIFMTQKAGLFSDIYRDLRDIGSGTLKPLILNSADKETDKETGEKHWKDTAGVMLDENGKLVYRSPESGLDKIIESGKVPDGYDFVVLTYSQLNSGDQQSRSESRKKVKDGTSQKSMAKAAFVRQIAADNYVLLDESHTAAGEGSNSGAFLRSVMPSVKGVTFSSATFAKRPDTMPLYAIKSAMSEANVEPDKLIGMIKKGGVTLQEIMARALTGSGQMVRRERDMSDVKTDWKTVDDPATAKKARANYDRAIEIFNKIISFQRNFITPVIQDISDDLAETMSVASETSGTRNFGVDNPPFVNQTYNFTKQLMLALKAEAIVEEVIKEIKAGRHPVIALENTYESGLDGYNVGDKIEDTSFSGGLTRSFARILQYTVTDPDGNKSQEFLSPEELGPEAARQYYALQEEIKEATKEIFLSPLDLIKQKLSEQGYKVGEVTGRKTQVVKEDGGYYLRQRTGDAKQAVREFNSGESDVIIINKSGSTGISLHASVAFKDQRQRSMIIAQPLGDINDYMQMIGRIDRTGQVHRGYYINLSLPVPAETRFNMMLATKLKSLNANTTTSQESDTGSVDAPDFLNKYGSQVVIEYLRDHPEVFGRLVETGMTLGSRPNFVTTSSALESYRAGEEDAQKVTGRIALLPVEEQEKFYADIAERYNALIRYLDETGENTLRITTLPLKAKTLARKVGTEGRDPSGSNPFAQNSYVERVEVDVLKKPMKSAEIQKVRENLTGGKPFDEYRDALIERVNEQEKARLAAEDERYARRKEKTQKEIDKQVAALEAKVKGMDDVTRKAEVARITGRLMANLEDDHNATVAGIKSQHRRLREKFEQFDFDETYLIHEELEGGNLIDDGYSPALFLGFKAAKEGDSLTPSTSVAVFATLDGRRRLEIKFTQSDILDEITNFTNLNYGTARETTLDNWDSSISNASREERYILTGNILQAWDDAQREGVLPGRLVSYTDIDGNIKDGILMNQSWKPDQLRSSGVPINSRTEQILNGESVRSSDGEIEIEHDYGDWFNFYVPKSKKAGGKYWQNEEILGLVYRGSFSQYRGRFYAEVSRANMRALLNILGKMGVRIQSEEGANDWEETGKDAGRPQDEEGTYFRQLTDADKIAELEAEEKVPVYRSALFVPDPNGNVEFDLLDGNGKQRGFLYPPMSVKVDGKFRDPLVPGTYDEAEERPDLATDDGYFWLVDDNGDKMKVAYAPYLHNRVTPLNEQFSAAYRRNLVVIRSLVPKSELESNYSAEKSRKSTGMHDWPSGTVSNALAKEGKDTRKVILSRWAKIGEPVSYAEVADEIVELIGDRDLAFEYNVVSPGLRKELQKRGVRFDGWHGNKPKNVDEIIAGMQESVSRRGENLRNPIDRAAAIVKMGEIAKKLGVKFKEDPNLKAKGSFSPKTGEIHINIDAHKNTADLEATLLHEAVAHYGLRKLFGKDWKELRMRLYEQASPEIKARVDAIAKADGLSAEVAMEEYIAQLAEDGRFDEQEESFWQKIVSALKQLLAKIGFNSGYLTDEDFRAMLYASYRNLQTGGALETAARVATAAALRRNAEASHEDNGPEDDGPGGGLPADTEEDMMGRGNDEVVREVSADLYDRYENQNGEDKPWMSENELIDRIEEELPYRIDTKELFAKIDEYRRLDEEDFNEGRRDFSGSERDNVFREIMAELERLSKERPVRLAVSDSSVSREKNEIKARSQANGTFMKAPNGQPTNLTEDQWLTVRTKAFKDWFGDWENDPANASKVVDENGEPLVVYRVERWEGDNADYTVFDESKGGNWRGFYFTNRDAALKNYGDESTLRAFFLDSKNPFTENNFNILQGDKQELIDMGHDGMIFAPDGINARNFEVKVFEPNQIKSATDNNGNFSTEDPDIYHRELSDLPESERDQAEDMEIDQDTEEYYRRDRGYSEAKTADDMYDRKTSTVSSALYTAQVDEYAPLDAFQQAISAEANKELSENERVSNRLRELGGQAMNEVRTYNEKFLQPMWKAIADLRKAVRGADGGKLSMQELTRYVGLKSGLERNELFAKRDAKKDAKSYYDKEYDNRKAELTTRENEEKARLKARLDEGIISDVTYQGELNALAVRIQQLKDKAEADHQANVDNVDKETASEYRRLYGEYRQKDFSGLLSWFTEEADLKRSDYPSRKAYQRAVNAARKNYVPGVTDLASAEAMAKQIVDGIESRAGSQVIGNLWNQINAATKETLDFQYRKNMISRQQRADISASMRYYIPMRGFEDATAEDLYSYYMKPNVSGFAPTILAAQGRHTRYRSPFGMIGFMHSSAVSQGLKNEAKLELLDFVRRNPKNTVATVTRAWFVKTGETDADGKPIYEVAYPQVPEGATIDERERIIEDFETDMKERKERGEAYNAHREVQMNGGVVAFEKDAHRTEHIVRVMEGGREYGIVINGNPAAAQAVNGIKRQGGYENFLEIMRATRRVLSQMFTTLSVPFWVSNFQRDHGQGGINTFVRNNLGYVGKYIINRWELLPQMIPLVLSRAEQGSFIDRLSPKFADYYRLYVENGGPMGQNRIETDVTFNRQLERYLRTQQNDKAYIKKGARALGDLLSAIGEGVETITRFATFVTSMEYGRPLHEAIADSKEVSTNFARKGHGRSISWEETGRMETRSGRQLGDTSGSAFETYRNYVDRALIVSSSAVLELLRAGIPFFNAAIQGIKNKTDNYRKNWVKALLADGTYFAIGFAMRYLIGGAGGDDDKEKYGHTSDYTRRNNFLTPLGEGRYHKWALSQEYRYMYALGDITAEALLQEKPYDDLALDAFEALVQVLPAGAVDPSARGEAFWIDAIKSVLPGVVTPIVEAFENKDFKGSRIYDEGFNGNKTDYPGWTKAIDTTGPGYVKAAEWLNQVSGGGEENATVRGSIDFNPAIVEHFVRSYLSGPYQIVGGVGTIVGKKMRGEDITTRDIPVWNRVFMNTNDNSRDAYYSGLYYYFKDRDKEARRLDAGMKGHQTQQAKDFRISKDYAYMLIFKKYESNERALNQMKKAAQNAGNEDAAKNVELKNTGIRENIAKECLDVYFDRVDWKSWLEKTNSGNEN